MSWLINTLIATGLPNDKAAEWVAALAGSIQAVTALIVATLALWQLRAIRKQLKASMVQTQILAKQTEIMARQRLDEEERERRWVTLQACERYDTDPVLHESFISLSEARLKLEGESNGAKGVGRAGASPRLPHKGELKHLKPQITTILNFLDGLAIGIRQDVYVEAMIKDQLKDAICHHVDILLERSYVEAVGVDPVHFESVRQLRRKWSDELQATEYRRGVNPSGR